MPGSAQAAYARSPVTPFAARTSQISGAANWPLLAFRRPALDTREDYTRSGYAADPQADAPLAKPLTLTITDQISGSISTACEVRSRLWGLRDRLFGPPPPSNTSGSAAKEASASCFSDAAKSGGRELRSVIDDIDALTLDLANRL